MRDAARASELPNESCECGRMRVSEGVTASCPFCETTAGTPKSGPGNAPSSSRHGRRPASETRAAGAGNAATGLQLLNERKSMRRITVTHTRSLTFDQAEVDAIYESGVLPIPGYVLSGDEATNPDARAIAVCTALEGSLLEVFNEVQDDDVGYEVEDYDPEA